MSGALKYEREDDTAVIGDTKPPAPVGRLRQHSPPARRTSKARKSKASRARRAKKRAGGRHPFKGGR